MANKPPAMKRGGVAPDRRTASSGRLRNAGVSPDAEDIAMARLQAHLRRSETIQAPVRSRAMILARTTVRLPDEMLLRLRDRARRAGLSVSEVVEAALARYLKLS